MATESFSGLMVAFIKENGTMACSMEKGATEIHKAKRSTECGDRVKGFDG